MQGLKILVTISVEVRIVNPLFFVVNSNTFGHCAVFLGKITTPPPPQVQMCLYTYAQAPRGASHQQNPPMHYCFWLFTASNEI